MRWLLLLLLALSWQARAQDLSCDDTSNTTTSAGLNTFLDSIVTGGASAAAPRVVCLTASAINMTSAVDWTVPDHVVLIGLGALDEQGGGATTTTFTDNLNTAATTLEFNSIDGYFRFAGWKWVAGGVRPTKEGGTISFGGQSTQVRVDHFTYDATNYGDQDTGSKQSKWFYIGGCLKGVMDSANIITPNSLSWIHFVNGSCPGGADDSGDVPWSEATGFGTGDFFYLEDIDWVDAGGAISFATVSDCHTGGKMVVRFSSFENVSVIQTHPTSHATDDRGCRAHENYANLAVSTAADQNFAFHYTNSGGGLMWGNNASGATENYFYINYCRATAANAANCGYGDGGWDGYCNQDSVWDGNDDAFGYPCIDQPGRGQGDLLTFKYPNKINVPLDTAAWPRQVLEPVYEWLNTGMSAGEVNNQAPDVIVRNRDYYLYDTTNCVAGGGCTQGVGSGTTLPTTCTTGVAFWKTNEGDWNESTSNPYGVQKNGADGILYKCVATNDWDPYYEPYTYPHPLRGEQELPSPEGLHLAIFLAQFSGIAIGLGLLGGLYGSKTFRSSRQHWSARRARGLRQG